MQDLGGFVCVTRTEQKSTPIRRARQLFRCHSCSPETQLSPKFGVILENKNEVEHDFRGRIDGLSSDGRNELATFQVHPTQRRGYNTVLVFCSLTLIHNETDLQPPNRKQDDDRVCGVPCSVWQPGHLGARRTASGSTPFDRHPRQCSECN